MNRTCGCIGTGLNAQSLLALRMQNYFLWPRCEHAQEGSYFMLCLIESPEKWTSIKGKKKKKRFIWQIVKKIKSLKLWRLSRWARKQWNDAPNIHRGRIWNWGPLQLSSLKSGMLIWEPQQSKQIPHSALRVTLPSSHPPLLPSHSFGGDPGSSNGGSSGYGGRC